MAAVELILERLIGVGHLDGIEVAPKQVFGQGEFEGVLVRKLADDGGHSLEASEASGAPAALAHHELEATLDGGVAAHENRLDDAAGSDGIGELRKRVFREFAARLKRVGINEVEAHLLDPGHSRLNRLQKSVQPPTQHLSRHGS